jgi:hypothetical protein
MYIIAAMRMISELVLKYLNGKHWVIPEPYPAPCPVALTEPRRVQQPERGRQITVPRFQLTRCRRATSK